MSKKTKKLRKFNKKNNSENSILSTENYIKDTSPFWLG